VENLWVPVSNVDKGSRWNPDTKDHGLKTTIDECQLECLASRSESTPLDLYILSKTTTALLNEFLTNPAPFTSTRKIQDVLEEGYLAERFRYSISYQGHRPGHQESESSCPTEQAELFGYGPIECS
jgi:hypothetical protein